jgi:hypothetical protein
MASDSVLLRDSSVSASSIASGDQLLHLRVRVGVVVAGVLVLRPLGAEPSDLLRRALVDLGLVGLLVGLAGRRLVSVWVAAMGASPS